MTGVFTYFQFYIFFIFLCTFVLLTRRQGFLNPLPPTPTTLCSVFSQCAFRRGCEHAGISVDRNNQLSGQQVAAPQGPRRAKDTHRCAPAGEGRASEAPSRRRGQKKMTTPYFANMTAEYDTIR